MAERLHMPVGVMVRNMTTTEYLKWTEYFAEPKETPISLATATPEQLKGLFG